MTRIGIVGTGGMANAYHARILNDVADVEIAACCDRDRERLSTFSDTWNVKSTYADYQDMIENEQLDGICNVTPDSMHAPISIYALKKDVSVLCEKPMAVTLDEAREMFDAARTSSAIHMVNYSKRDFSGLRGSKLFIDSGGVGRIMHVECSYLQGWLSDMDYAGAPPSKLWRLSTAHGSNGDLGDLGCHIYDMATYLCGDIESLSCVLKAFEKPVEGNRVGEYVMDANDGFASAVTFVSGAIGTIQSTRWATSYRNREFIRVYGDKATLEFDADVGRDSFRYRKADEESWTEETVPPTPTNVERFIESIKTGDNDPNDFQNGLKIQAYLDASVESSRKGTTVHVPHYYEAERSNL